MMPKALQKVIGKVDPRKVPPEHEVKKFKEGAGRRYINVGLSTRDFYNGIADKMDDDELKENAKEIEKAIYSKDDEMFKVYSTLFQSRMSELGVWKSVKGLSRLQKAQLMGKLASIAKKQQQQEADKKNKERNAREFKDRGDF